MIFSMTGYGKGTAEMEGYSLSVEIRSVNHRYGEMSVKLPRLLLALESDIKKQAADRLKRGRIDIAVLQDTTAGTTLLVPVLNRPLAEAYGRIFNELKEVLGWEGELSPALIAAQKDVVLLREEEADTEKIRVCLARAMGDALDQIVAMRKVEGEAIAQDILSRLEVLTGQLAEVKALAPQVPGLWRQKLQERLERLGPDLAVDPARIAQEVAFFADRCDISEEIVRLDSHIDQFRALFDIDEPVGRKMDFLVQEMNREANTIGSKANHPELSSQVVALKAELEKIREQVQNIE